MCVHISPWRSRVRSHGFIPLYITLYQFQEKIAQAANRSKFAVNLWSEFMGEIGLGDALGSATRNAQPRPVRQNREFAGIFAMNPIRLVLRGTRWLKSRCRDGPIVIIGRNSAEQILHGCAQTLRIRIEKPMENKKDRLPPIFFEDLFDQHYRIAWRVEEAKPDPNNPLPRGGQSLG